MQLSRYKSQPDLLNILLDIDISYLKHTDPGGYKQVSSGCLNWVHSEMITEPEVFRVENSKDCRW